MYHGLAIARDSYMGSHERLKSEPYPFPTNCEGEVAVGIDLKLLSNSTVIL